MASYVERLTKIRDALEETAGNINDKDNPSEAEEEKAEAYGQAIDCIDDAISALESVA